MSTKSFVKLTLLAAAAVLCMSLMWSCRLLIDPGDYDNPGNGSDGGVNVDAPLGVVDASDVPRPDGGEADASIFDMDGGFPPRDASMMPDADIFDMDGGFFKDAGFPEDADIFMLDAAFFGPERPKR